MQAHKVSISLSKSLTDFVQLYQLEHHYTSRSQVIAAALELLRNQALELDYQSANEELDSSFDNTIGDGLSDDETW